MEIDYEYTRESRKLAHLKVTLSTTVVTRKTSDNTHSYLTVQLLQVIKPGRNISHSMIQQYHLFLVIFSPYIFYNYNR